MRCGLRLTLACKQKVRIDQGSAQYVIWANTSIHASGNVKVQKTLDVHEKEEKR
jgi:hypothetical protein